VLHFKK